MYNIIYKMVENKEFILKEYQNIISYECTKKIIEKMERDICLINIGVKKGTGFFCKIPFPKKENMLPVLITNNNIIDEDLLNQENIKIELNIKGEEKIKEIINTNNRMKYTNKDYDITIIEIKEEDNINNFLELDDIIIDNIINNEDRNKGYINEKIYIIQNQENNLSVSYGILNGIYEDKKYIFNSKSNSKCELAGSPILNINNKLIGIYKEGNDNTQYNKGAFLNYPIKEFIELYEQINEIVLKKYNDKYNLDIKDTKINKLDLGYKNLGNDALNELDKIEFKELKELYLDGNEISDIKILEKFKFNNLEILNLGMNQISDISILEKLDFKKLKELSLYKNKIADIKVFEKVKFEKLEILNLSNNKIFDINILKNMNFMFLKELYLDHNTISDIKVFEKVEFGKLEILGLKCNQISESRNASIISKLKSKIKELDI